MLRLSSMSASELVGLIYRLNPDIECVWGGRGQVGLYYGGKHVGGITQSGSLPPRSIRDAEDVIEVRGWMDVLAGLYGARIIGKSQLLVRLMGDAALDLLSRTGSLPVEAVAGVPGSIKRDTVPARHEWLGRDAGSAA